MDRWLGIGNLHMTSPLLNKPKILLVNDKPENLVILEQILTPLEVQLIKANSGNEALAYTLEQDIMLILLDVQMPGMNGYELFEILSWDERTRHVPVIFITDNFAEGMQRLKEYTGGTVDYLSKPVNSLVMLGKVKLFLKLHQQRHRLIQLQETYQSILESAGEGVIGLDPHGLITFVNPAVCQLLGWEMNDVIGTKIELLLAKSQHQSGQTRWQDSGLYQQCLQGNVYKQPDGEFIKQNGDTLPVHYTATPIHDGHKTLQSILLIFMDMTNHKNLQKQLNEMAHHDYLTDLPNRLLFEKTLNQELARCRRHQHNISLVFIDLDNFKLINERLGHDIGDILLQSFAKRLQGCVRENDTVTRLEGDKFAIILDHVNNEKNSIIVAEKILKTMQSPFQIHSHLLHAKISLGIAQYPEAGLESKTLVSHAGQALAQAKNKGGNQYCLYSPMPNSATSDQQDRDKIRDKNDQGKNIDKSKDNGKGKDQLTIDPV